MQHKPHNATSPPLEGKPSGFRSLVGYHPVEWTEGHAVIELDIGPQHLNSLGIVHGGVYMALMDAAMGHAVAWACVEGNIRKSVTLSLTTRFLASVDRGRLRATGTLLGVEGRAATTEARILSAAGDLLAAGQATFLYLPGSERREGVPRGRPAAS
jgi:uncharacterized protein (TIGR00369 family)